ncbi:MAG: pyruvate, water dikinase [Sulfurimonas sp.]|uniref:pyruvate, water dikinase n=1 Tax=Sulfurimonas sp. TaxID=2022749 RepID=UPI00261202DE|nr:pyruvate, water dikinase [Sulfurimonas sp.]MDD5372868.1 pyruvate, water dikinase [Sulfurimonas sp.]
MQYIRFFSELNIGDISIVGGKNASLGEMYQNLTLKGVNIPNGFATTSDAYWLLLQENGIKDKIAQILSDLDIADTDNLQKRGLEVRTLILNSHLPKALVDELLEAYKILSNQYNSQNIDVAVRSSGTAEDLPDASFAGQQETFLNVNSKEALLESVLRCFASLFTDRAISYRTSRGFSHFKVALSVGVQKMVRSDISSSGIMFTIDTESGSENLILINSIWGLGENVVSGRVNADEFFIFKPTLKNGINTILKHSLGSKKEKMLYSEDKRTINVGTTKEEQESFSINDDEVIKLAKQALLVEEHYGRPMDIEWAKDGNDSKLYIVQARPETVMSKQNKSMTSKQYSLNAKDAKILTSGRAIGEKIGIGKITVINDTTEFARFKEGDILVADTTNPDWEPVMKKASAVITNRGSRTCHAAIVAREIGVPAVVGCGNATAVLQDGQKVTVSCAEGDEGYVYEGELEYYIKTIDMSKLQPTKTKLFVNVGNPAEAFNFAKMPNDGVGLARMEFIMNNSINAHPMALVDMHKGISVTDEDKIRSFMTPCSDTKEFFLQKISEGVGMIAAAFYPKPVIIRTSDFKSNEYRGMTGGLIYEAEEENPMIGFRGASRYYDDSYREAFMWECEALKRVRDDMGLTNIKIMIPFVRTPQEGKKVIEIMHKQGLTQGKNSLEIYAMCEIPANVIIADEFLEVFDGYSIGSNDLTQLTLGVDRESAKIAHIFDERNEAVKRMLKMAIEACKTRGKYIGICGQAPSDYPEITEFLVQNGIDSISLNPDSLFKMRQVVSDLE